MRSNEQNRTQRDGNHGRALATLFAAALVAAGCATTAPKKSAPAPSARIEIQASVGFTITEEARVGNAVRLEYEEALAHLRRGQLEQGIAILERVVATAPALSAPQVDLGIAWHLAGDLGKAEAALRAALETSPDHPIAHNELGIVYRKTGRFDAARQSYEAALAIYPGYHFARRNLAILCDLYLADLECALSNYEAYMETVPGDDEAAMWIADLSNRMGRGGSR